MTYQPVTASALVTLLKDYIAAGSSIANIKHRADEANALMDKVQDGLSLTADSRFGEWHMDFGIGETYEVACRMARSLFYITDAHKVLFEFNNTTIITRRKS